LDVTDPDSQPNNASGPATSVEIDGSRGRSAGSVRVPRSGRGPAGQAIEWRLNEEVVLEQVSTDPYELSYAFLLIPRFQQHELKGDLAEELNLLMKGICQSGGWALDYLSIRPQYLQWIVRSRANVSSANIVHVVRTRTSTQIMENFPLIRQENLSSDFWAPGYLLVVGREPHPAERVNEFIRLIRQQQQFRNAHHR
jgi:REP element-mobilizing transposase RayT